MTMIKFKKKKKRNTIFKTKNIKKNKFEQINVIVYRFINKKIEM